jgi:hypothetical protein
MPSRGLCIVFVGGLALSTGACGVPAALTAGSYAADGGLALSTHKTSTDHFLSMVSKKDCSIWRVFRHQLVCKDRPEGSRDPYDVNYDEPFRSQSEGGGVQYGPPLHSTADAPAMSWDAAAYKPAPGSPNGATTTLAAAAPAPIAAETFAPPSGIAGGAPALATNSPALKKKRPAHAKAKKPSPNQVANAH